MSDNPVLVVGGGPAGLEATRSVADLGYKVVLVDKAEFLGGTPISGDYAALTPDMRNTEEAMGEMIGRIEGDPNVEIRMNTEVVAAEGDAPELRVTMKNSGGEEVLEAGGVIVATGFQHFDPGRETQMYGYYEFDDVITLVDAERMLKAGSFIRPSTGEEPRQLCFIQCVAAGTGRSGISGARKCVAVSRAKRPSKFAKWCPTAGFSSSTSICGCTASGKTNSTGRLRRNTRSTSSAEL